MQKKESAKEDIVLKKEVTPEMRQAALRYVMDTAQQRFCPILRSTCIESCVAFSASIGDENATAKCTQFGTLSERAF